MNSFLEMENGEKEWMTHYLITSNDVDEQTLIRRKTKGSELLEMRRQNQNFKVSDFVPLTVEKDLHKQYKMPKPIPQNLLEKCSASTGGLMINLNSANTGMPLF